MASKQLIVCPKCQRSDRVQKVSAVVAGGTKLIEERGGIDIDTHYGMDVIPLTYSSVARSHLASKLAAPQKPLQTKSDGCITALFISRLGVALVVSVMLIALFFCSYPFLAATYTQNNSLFIGILIAGFGIIGVILFSAVRASWRQSRSTIERQISYDTRVQAWETAYARWKQLYYCFQDDGVFIPGRSTFVPTEKVQDYLNREFNLKNSGLISEQRV